MPEEHYVLPVGWLHARYLWPTRGWRVFLLFSTHLVAYIPAYLTFLLTYIDDQSDGDPSGLLVVSHSVRHGIYICSTAVAFSKSGISGGWGILFPMRPPERPAFFASTVAHSGLQAY